MHRIQEREFRQAINRCLSLRKRLGISRETFIMCGPELSSEHAVALPSMHDLSLANARDLFAHLEKLVW